MNKSKEELQAEFLAVYDTNNTNIDESVVEAFISGYCFHLALVLHKRKGWPIYNEYDSDKENPYDPYCHRHSWVKNPDGNAVDINGIHVGNYGNTCPWGTFDDMGDIYSDEQSKLPTRQELENPNAVDAKILAWAEAIVDANPEHFGV